ncbi:MAG: carboxypeptidase-like regulatory domain-containing protein, partial [Planctomycetota bacterium]
GDGIVNVDDLVELIIDWGCQVPVGDLTDISGTITNMWTDEPIAGAEVRVGTALLITDLEGQYEGSFLPGQYEITADAQNFFDDATTIVLFPDLPVTLDFALEPVAPVIVTVEVIGDPEPGADVEATAIVEVLDGSTIESYSWTQIGGAETELTDAATDTVTVGLADAIVYKEMLIEALKEPPISEEQLPPNVPLPPGEFPGGLQNRFQLVGLNPFMLEESGAVVLEVDVATTSGNYLAHGDVHTHLPWSPTAGIRNVPINVPVLLYGKDQLSYNWTLMAPPNSSAVLIDAETQYPEFTPDVAGIYEVSITDEATAGAVTIEIFAGTFRGIITGQDENGRPEADATCVSCHELLGAEKFTPWAQTGHAELFTNNINSSAYWGTQCFQCHTVGYNLEADNNGIDEAPDFEAFLNGGLLGNPSPDNWTTTLEQFPSTALQANIQCENCHGPQWGLMGVNTLAHGPVNPEGAPRVSLSSDVCATCHGEPLRHARFQQWQLSAHANYEVAIDESQSGNCSRCHTVNGFLEWLPVLTGDAPGDPHDNITVTWTEDESHPQTCVTCHDPHNAGTTSGINTNAPVRIAGDTPPLIAGFTVYGAGRGAICMTCHNSRRGLRNDSTFEEFYLTAEAARAPHGSAQTDLLMGQNAYLVTTGVPGAHSFLTDSCVQCHMEQTLPPDDLSYNNGGTNHTFYASNTICTNCHTGLDGPTVQAGVESTLHVLQDAVEDGLLALIDEQTSMGNIIDLDGEMQITSAAEISEIVFGEYRGRQSMTITFTDMSTVGPYRMSDVAVLDPMMAFIGDFYDFADPSLIKAGWNWGLVHNDGSLGAHNPTYAYTVLSNSISAIDPAAAELIEFPEWFEANGQPRKKLANK